MEEGECVDILSSWKSVKSQLHGVSLGGAPCRVSAEVAPEKALRSLVFLVTTIRELGSAIAKTEGDAPLEASILEAAFQVRRPSRVTAVLAQFHAPLLVCLLQSVTGCGPLCRC